MSDVVIRVEKLSKKYTIRHQNGRDDGLRHAIQNLTTAPFRWLVEQKAGLNVPRNGSTRHGARSKKEEFYALKDVAFEVERGEVVGIVGRNGAGKSTLLKILSRITEPTEGQARIKGRVASLLEVGTGFHPELTGRENIFLNGGVLGMTRQEIDRKFDEIVEFSGIGKFLDTPVKRYSSGMSVRLAFAVAAHLEPEILLIDEVLAVGDAEFQRKCLGKMRDVTADGRTVLFVSHNMSAVRNLCDRVLLIEQGRLAMDGAAEPAIAAYLNRNLAQGAEVCGDDLDAKAAVSGWDGRGNHAIRCKAIRLLDSDGQPSNEFVSNQPISVEVAFECLGHHHDPRIVISVVDEDNQPILTTQNVDEPATAAFYQLSPGMYRSRCTFPKDLFGEKRLYISLSLTLPHIDHLAFEKILAFDVKFAGYNNIQYMNHKEVFIRPRLRWETECVSPREKAVC